LIVQPDRISVLVTKQEKMVGAVGIELLFNFTKTRVFTVLPTVNQMKWS